MNIYYFVIDVFEILKNYFFNKCISYSAFRKRGSSYLEAAKPSSRVTKDA